MWSKGKSTGLNSKQSRKKTIDKELKRILKLISERYRPEKVILFGSAAKGTIKENSDIDVLIIKKTSKGFLSRVDEVMGLTHPRVGIDIFVLTPQEVISNQREKNPYLEEILNEGTIVYEKAS